MGKRHHSFNAEKREVVREISPPVSGSNPALGTTMDYMHKPKTLYIAVATLYGQTFMQVEQSIPFSHQ